MRLSEEQKEFTLNNCVAELRGWKDKAKQAEADLAEMRQRCEAAERERDTLRGQVDALDESHCANCGIRSSRAEKIIPSDDGEWFCSDLCEQQHDEMGCPFEGGEYYRHPIETAEAERERDTLRGQVDALRAALHPYMRAARNLETYIGGEMWKRERANTIYYHEYVKPFGPVCTALENLLANLPAEAKARQERHEETRRFVTAYDAYEDHLETCKTCNDFDELCEVAIGLHGQMCAARRVLEVKE